MGLERKIAACTPTLGVVVWLLVTAGLPGRAQNPAPIPKEPASAVELVQEMVQTELQAQLEDTSLWRYREWQEAGGKEELFDVIDTKDGTIDRLLSVNKQPLTPDQRRKEDARLERFLHDPDQFRREQKERREDAEKERRMLRLLPDIFSYRYSGGDQNLVRLSFSPNPRFRPPSEAARVFHDMEGYLVIDKRQKRLVEIHGRLMSEVKFLDGLLGHLNPGGTFLVKQKDVGSGHWEMEQLDVQMKGKFLFFKTIGVQQDERFTSFQPAPAEMTLQQAVELLEKEAVGFSKTAYAGTRAK
jgi:hypothetical protein